jgi:IS5 family transposase
MENRNGLLVDLRIAPANQSERVVALALLEARIEGAATVASDRGYDVRNFVEGCRTLGITRVAVSAPRLSDRRPHDTARWLPDQPAGPETSRRDLWLAQDSGDFRKTRFRGIERTQLAAHLGGAAYNLLRIAKLTAAPA